MRINPKAENGLFLQFSTEVKHPVLCAYSLKICNPLVTDVFEFLHLCVVTFFSQSVESFCQLKKKESYELNV